MTENNNYYLSFSVLVDLQIISGSFEAGRHRFWHIIGLHDPPSTLNCYHSLSLSFLQPPAYLGSSSTLRGCPSTADHSADLTVDFQGYRALDRLTSLSVPQISCPRFF